ncbi:hypothetical protein FPY71_10220 [Aureimonas fodinaquatilis]|uniref:Uncharacterized protein n=1 Tax=Aureimonas fodinaquatilis TaxID=2565783 RepID=A0A5B0DXV7_9HYPH|nr:hypothetical protein [Aureimonas fodinaquatilis]KAA0970842.1 hypothetical protein FPY71_10220 [Aureimonas fodinaquatilis]
MAQYSAGNVDLVSVRIRALEIVLASEVLYWTDNPANAKHISETMEENFQMLSAQLGYKPVKVDEAATATYFAVDADGTFFEAPRGSPRSDVVNEIATGGVNAYQVFRQQGALFEEVTLEIAREALQVVKAKGPDAFIPALVCDLLDEEVESLRNSWMTQEQHKLDREACSADARYATAREELVAAE